MKVTYEFDEEDEYDTRKLFEISRDMYYALYNINDYLRSVCKGYKDDNIDLMIETIREFICESEIHKIP